MRSFFRSSTSGRKLEELVATLPPAASKGGEGVPQVPPTASPVEDGSRIGRGGRRKAKALDLESPITPNSIPPPPTARPQLNGNRDSYLSNGSPVGGEGDKTLIDPDLVGEVNGKRKVSPVKRDGSPIHNTRKRSPGSIASMKAKYMSPPDEDELDEYSPPKQKRKPNRRDPVARQRQNRDAQQTYRDQKKSFADANADFVMEALVIMSAIKRPSPAEQRLLELRDDYLPKAQACWPTGFERFQERVEEQVRENKHKEA